MNPTDIESALCSRLASLAGVQWLFPNVTADPDPPVKPYATVALSLDSVTDRTMDSTGRQVNGRMLIVIVTQEGSGTLVPGRIRNQIADLFPRGLALPFPGGTLEFRQHPQPKPPYAQGGNWRSPIEISYIAT